MSVGGLSLIDNPVKVGVEAQATPTGTNFHPFVDLPLESGASSGTILERVSINNNEQHGQSLLCGLGRSGETKCAIPITLHNKCQHTY